MKARIKNLILFGIFSIISWEIICLVTLVMPFSGDTLTGAGDYLALIVLAPALALITTVMYAVFEFIKSYGS